MLPLLIPHLKLSLATAGTLAMCFQMANSVSQLGFGALADRWKPRALISAGRSSRSRPELHRTGELAVDARRDSGLRRARRRGVSSAGRGAGLPPRRPSQGPGDVGAHLGRLARFCGRAAVVRAVHRAHGAAVVAADHAARPARAVVDAAAGAADGAPAPHERSSWATLRPAAVPLALLYFTVVLRTATSYGFMTFAPTLLTRQGCRSTRRARRCSSIC